MILNGKAYITRERVMQLLGLEEGQENSLYQPPYSIDFKDIGLDINRGYRVYEQEAIYAYLEIRRMKEIFHCELSSLVLMIVDESGYTGSYIAKRLGFPHLQNMFSWIDAKKSKHDGRVLVRCCKHFREYVREYDEMYL